MGDNFLYLFFGFTSTFSVDTVLRFKLNMNSVSR